MFVELKRKLAKNKFWVFGLFIIFLFFISGCVKRSDRVDIILIDEDLTISEVLTLPLDQLPLTDEPIVADEDIRSYDWDSHSFEISKTAMEQVTTIDKPGVPFVVAVNGEPIYVGAFWVLWSSLSFDGVVIIPPLEEGATTLTLEAGYPGYPIDETWTDPRSDDRIKKALRESGKVR